VSKILCIFHDFHPSVVKDKAEKEIAEGKGITFTNKDDMNAWLNKMPHRLFESDSGAVKL